MRFLYVSTFALAAAVSAWGATVCASQARELSSSGSMALAAERYAVPLVALAALSAASLGCAAAAATDQRY
jgi:hypothetical protein